MSVNGSVVRPSPVFLGILGVSVLGGVLCALSDFGSSGTYVLGSHPVQPTAGVVLLVLGGWGVSLCLHEFGHAYLALRGGDVAVRAKGYLDLDPRRYTDPVFSLILPLIFLLIGGIPLPGGAVWINHHMLRDKRAESLVSLAGPAANLILGVLIALAIRFIDMPVALLAGLAYLALVQLIAFVLNVLPVPGLDGWGIWEPFMPQAAREFGQKVRPWAPLVLFVLLIGFGTLAGALYEAGNFLTTGIGGVKASVWSIGYRLFLFWQ